MRVTKIASQFLNHDKGACPNALNGCDRKPIITPLISSNSNHGAEDGQRYLLLPGKDHILVMAMEHGQTVCKLTYPVGNYTDDKYISSATLVAMETTRKSSHPNANFDASESENEGGFTPGIEYVLIAALDDGTLCEWCLSSIPFAKKNGLFPRRSFRIKDHEILNLVVPSLHPGGVVYAIVKQMCHTQMKRRRLVSFQLPSCDDVAPSPRLLQDAIQLTERAILSLTQNLKDIGTTDKHNLFQVSTFPDSILAVTSQNFGRNVEDGETMVGMATKTGMIVYHESTDQCIFLNRKQPDEIITAAALSPNGKDIVFGYSNGKIDILVDALDHIHQFVSYKGNKKQAQASEVPKIKAVTEQKPMRHPNWAIVVRTVHWHSLPVKTLSYLGVAGSRATPSLLSGGEEAVLVTWSMERGQDKPSFTCPRIAKGCISHIVTNTRADSAVDGVMDTVVVCMDGTVQVIQGHNHGVRWKIQGLACALNECAPPMEPAASTTKSMIHDDDWTQQPLSLLIDPKSRAPIISNMAGAPGFVHWFDPKTNQVVGELEIAPYNRVSRKEAHHKAYPRPNVTHLVMSKTGNDMITIDTILSENCGVGNACDTNPFVDDEYVPQKKSLNGFNPADKKKHKRTEKMSFATNIKFWSWSGEMERTSRGRQNGMPYELVAAMPAPHGLVKGSVDGLAISPDGSRACTLSYEEGAFHIWAKGQPSGFSIGKVSLTPNMPSWKRLCKIAIPSGYSNSSRGNNRSFPGSLIRFSADGSVLAIVFGRHVTLWDHTSATMLNSVCAPEALRDIFFVRSPLDMIVAVGDSSVSVLAPFGNGYLGNASWSYKLPDSSTLHLGDVATVASLKELAISLLYKQKKKWFTKIVRIDVLTGKAKTRHGGKHLVWNVRGRVQCLSDMSKAEVGQITGEKDIALLALTQEGEMLALDTKGKNTEIVQQSVSLKRIDDSYSLALKSNHAPKVDDLKRKRITSKGSEQAKNRMRSENITGALLFNQSVTDSETTPLPTSQLPSLSGAFARSFMARNVKKTS